VVPWLRRWRSWTCHCTSRSAVDMAGLVRCYKKKSEKLRTTCHYLTLKQRFYRKNDVNRWLIMMFVRVILISYTYA
jgi:hypothetical protein